MPSGAALRSLAVVVMVAMLGSCTAEKKPRVAPTVAKPVDLGVLATSPCQALSENQSKDLGYPRKGGEFHNRKEGRLACGWDDFQPATELHFLPYPDKSILREVYEKTPAGAHRFEEFEAEGFPAVAVVDDTNSGMCTVTVGLSEKEGFQFEDLAEPGSSACNRAKDASWLVAQNLRAPSRAPK